MIKKLKNHQSAQCHIFEGNNREYLISYRTKVLIVDYEAKTMEVTGLYSMTTRKHIGWYLMERFPNITYHMVKKAHEEGKKIDILTGELI